MLCIHVSFVCLLRCIPLAFDSVGKLGTASSPNPLGSGESAVELPQVDLKLSLQFMRCDLCVYVCARACACFASRVFRSALKYASANFIVWDRLTVVEREQTRTFYRLKVLLD